MSLAGDYRPYINYVWQGQERRCFSRYSPSREATPNDPQFISGPEFDLAVLGVICPVLFHRTSQEEQRGCFRRSRYVEMHCGVGLPLIISHISRAVTELACGMYRYDT